MKYEWTAEAPGWKLSDGEIDWSVMSDSKSKPSQADEIDAFVTRLRELNANETSFAEAAIGEEFPEGYEKLFPAPKPDPKLAARDQAMARALTFSGDYDCRALWLLY